MMRIAEEIKRLKPMNRFKEFYLTMQELVLKNEQDKKAGALHYSLQQTHGGQSVTQPAPNCLSATSPC
jgi:hypothetical protein